MKRTVKIIVGFVVAVLILLVGVIVGINTSFVQDKLVAYAVNTLSEKLQTRVSLERLNFDLFRQDIRLHGLYIEDQQQRPLLRMERLTADLDLPALLHHELRIPEIRVSGLQAELHKTASDSVSNFQFVIDAFKKDSLQREPQTDSTRHQLTFDVSRFTAERVAVTFNKRVFSLGKLQYVQEDWDSVSKPMRHVTIDDLYFKNEHDRPRKNYNKPHRGFFDPAYLDVTARLKIDIDHLQRDSIHAVLRECFVCDSVTGIDIRNMHAVIAATPQTVHVRDLVVRQVDTEVSIDTCELLLPNKKTGQTMTYHTSMVRGYALLRDISRPFAPVLKDFTLPLQFRALVHGDDDMINFTDVEVTTPDKLLKVQAKGFVRHLRNKYDLHVHFDVPMMYARGGEKERIIKQFPIKRFFMEQLHALGTITFRGDLDAYYKHEVFKGVLGTMAGPMKVKVDIDDKNRYLSGHVDTKAFQLGKVFDMPEVGDVGMTADFTFDISKVRTAVMRHRKGGKLPIGEVTAHVTKASYRFIKTQNLQAHIVSDGAVAEGNLQLPGGHMDILCSFSFTNTNELKKMKIKPGVKFHRLSEERKAKKALAKKARAHK